MNRLVFNSKWAVIMAMALAAPQVWAVSPPDTIHTAGGDVVITPIQHASLMLQADG